MAFDIKAIREHADAERLSALPEAEQLLPYTWRTQPDYEAVLSDIAEAIAERDATIARLTQERDTATRRVEALEAEIGRLRELFESTRRWGATVDKCPGDDKPCYAGTGDDAHWRCGTNQCARKSAPPAADYTERAFKLLENITHTDGFVTSDAKQQIIAALTAAERAGAEKMRALDEAVIEAGAQAYCAHIGKNPALARQFPAGSTIVLNDALAAAYHAMQCAARDAAIRDHS